MVIELGRTVALARVSPIVVDSWRALVSSAIRTLAAVAVVVGGLVLGPSIVAVAAVSLVRDRVRARVRVRVRVRVRG